MISLEIRNLGTGTKERGNYRAFLTLPELNKPGCWESHEITIDNYDRSKGWFPLLCQALVGLDKKKKIEDTTKLVLEVAEIRAEAQFND